MKKLALVLTIIMLTNNTQAGNIQLTGSITAGNDGEAFRRLAQSMTALSVSTRTLYADTNALMEEWQKINEQLTWWVECDKSAACLDWLRSGISSK